MHILCLLPVCTYLLIGCFVGVVVLSFASFICLSIASLLFLYSPYLVCVSLRFYSLLLLIFIIIFIIVIIFIIIIIVVVTIIDDDAFFG